MQHALSRSNKIQKLTISKFSTHAFKDMVKTHFPSILKTRDSIFHHSSMERRVTVDA